MTYFTRLALRIAILAFTTFTIGMMVSTIVGYTSEQLSYQIFGIGLGISLTLLCISFMILTKSFKGFYLTFQLFFTLSLINLVDEITNMADVPKVGEWFVFIGIVYYFVVLINKTLIQK